MSVSREVLAALEHAREPGVDPALVALAWAYEEILADSGLSVEYPIGGGIRAIAAPDFQMELALA